MPGRDDSAPELPRAYGRSRVVLLGVDPFRIHVYWELTDKDRRRALAQLDPLGRHGAPTWVLRFHDVTSEELDGTGAQDFFDVPVDLAAANWYVELWSSDRMYFAELGPRSDTGFVAACRSNIEHVPRAERAPRYEPRWRVVAAAGAQGGAPAKADSTPPVAAPAPHVASARSDPPAPGDAAMSGETLELDSSGTRSAAVPDRPAGDAPAPPAAAPVLPPPGSSFVSGENQRSASVSLGGGRGSGSGSGGVGR